MYMQNGLQSLSYVSKKRAMRLLFAFCISCCMLQVSAQDHYLFIGTYTSNGSKGIYVYKFDSKTGEASWVSNTDSSSNPSFLAVTRDGKYVYAVNEVSRDNQALLHRIHLMKLQANYLSSTNNPAEVKTPAMYLLQKMANG
jgi:DNA-binding beta-propeller fold protein YncE